MSFVSDQSSFPLGNVSFGSNTNQYLNRLNSFVPLQFASANTSSTGANVGNVAGVAKATQQAPSTLQDAAAMLKAIYTDPNFSLQPEAVRTAALNQLGAMSTKLDLDKVMAQMGINRENEIKMLLEGEEKRAAQANEWGKENLKLANEMKRSNSVLNTLLQMPGQIADTWARAATAGLPYQQEARQMMANTAANLQTGYTNLANMNTQFGNQVSNLFSNAASYRPTLIAGKYF
jgi:hypothetical protein